jgi:hypothetical protein
MLLQAAGFALLAAISPTALIVLAVFLGSSNARSTATFYLIGAAIMTAVTAVVALVVIRSIGLQLPHRHAPRYGLRLGLGVLALAAAAFVCRRKAPPPDPARPQQGLVSRLIAQPRPVTGFVAGLLLFAPSLTFLGAVQAIATAQASVGVTIVALLLITVISLLIVWLPLLGYLAAPQWTTRKLTAINGWLRANGRAIMMACLVVAGLALLLDGAVGLALRAAVLGRGEQAGGGGQPRRRERLVDRHMVLG